jgi:hypothetical protein
MNNHSPRDSLTPSDNEDFSDMKTLYQKSETKLETTKFLRISLKSWNTILFMLNMTSIILSICSLGTPRWVEQGDPAHFWRGGLLKCTGCNGQFSEKSYKEITRITCDDFKGYCKTFNNLLVAGICFLLSCLIYFLLTLIWSILLLYENYGRDFNLRFKYLIIAGAPFVLMVGTISWHLISNADYSDSCYESFTSKKNSENLCAIDGPVILICSLSLSATSSLLYFIIKIFISNSLENKIQPYIS